MTQFIAILVTIATFIGTIAPSYAGAYVLRGNTASVITTDVVEIGHRDRGHRRYRHDNNGSNWGALVAGAVAGAIISGALRQHQREQEVDILIEVPSRMFRDRYVNAMTYRGRPATAYKCMLGQDAYAEWPFDCNGRYWWRVVLD